MILLLDTSTGVCHVTIVDGEARHDYDWQADRQLTRGLLSYLRNTLAQHEKTLNDVTALGVFQGPGSFTGLRIGLTVCNTMAEACEIPIVGTTGESWREVALERLRRAENDRIVLPLYGRDARITTPRK